MLNEKGEIPSQVHTILSKPPRLTELSEALAKVASAKHF
jgi:hypothetical protein